MERVTLKTHDEQTDVEWAMIPIDPDLQKRLSLRFDGETLSVVQLNDICTRRLKGFIEKFPSMQTFVQLKGLKFSGYDCKDSSNPCFWRHLDIVMIDGEEMTNVYALFGCSAALHGNFNAMKILLEAGLDPNTVYSGESLLMTSMMLWNPMVTALLINHGADFWECMVHAFAYFDANYARRFLGSAMKKMNLRELCVLNIMMNIQLYHWRDLDALPRNNLTSMVFTLFAERRHGDRWNKKK